TLIAGNIATLAAARDFSYMGVHVGKCGIGGGSLCSTRLETGNGVPQLTALMECREGAESVPNNKMSIIADGGIRKVGDIVKALVFADAVMLGNMLAGTDETPSELININGIDYKRYVGSSTHKTNHIEGVEALVPYKGSVKNVLQKIKEGVRSGMSYQNARNLNELKKYARFIEQSNAGQIESAPHDIL
ncbi:MAG: IMP dehydrogenase, partial [Thioploca sp.]|nr:IMP dehydrogenase [Thioploca sp.]